MTDTATKAKPIVVRGDAYWACLRDPNELSDKYQIDICNIDKPTLKQLKEAGITIKKETDDKHKGQGYFITAKSLQRPRIKTADGGVFPIDDTLIGNGSKVKAAIRPVFYKNKFGQGITTGLGAVMVLELVEFSGGDDGADLLEPEGESPFADDDVLLEDDDFDTEDLD